MMRGGAKVTMAFILLVAWMILVVVAYLYTIINNQTAAELQLGEQNLLTELRYKDNSQLRMDMLGPCKPGSMKASSQGYFLICDDSGKNWNLPKYQAIIAPNRPCDTLGALRSSSDGVLTCASAKLWTRAMCDQKEMLTKDDAGLTLACDGKYWRDPKQL